MSNKTVGLVLTGGGAKAAYQAGAIAALAEILPQQTSPFKVISGTSAGAINAAFLAASAENWVNGAQKLRDRWGALTLDHVYRTDGRSLFKIAWGWITRTIFGGKLSKSARANYLLDTQPLHEMLKKDVDFVQLKKNIDSGLLRAVAFTTTQYFSATSISYFDAIPEVELWVRTNRFGLRTKLGPEHVMASSAIPIFFPPIEIDDKFYGDGSLRQTTPLSSAIHLGANRIISIGIRHERKTDEETAKAEKPSHTAPSLAQITGELLNSIFLDSMDFDIERLAGVNKNLQIMELEFKGKKPETHYQRVDHLHLRPSKDLQSLIPSTLRKFPPLLQFLFRGMGASSQQGNDLMGYLSFLPECSGPLMALGYEDTMKKKDLILGFLSRD
jgi:NTE family protein